MDVSDQLMTVGLPPPISSWLLPCVAPNPEPVIVICVPTGPLEGKTAVTTGVITVKLTVWLLPMPPTTTRTGPVVAKVGTVAVICVSDQDVAVAVVPLMVTVLVPCVEPNPLPLICTGVPGSPLTGLNELTATAATLKETEELLEPAPTVTLTAPDVAPEGTVAVICESLQLETVAFVVLNATVLVPCELPKPLPVMVTAVPTGPPFGEKSFTYKLKIGNPMVVWTPPTVK